MPQAAETNGAINGYLKSKEASFRVNCDDPTSISFIFGPNAVGKSLQMTIRICSVVRDGNCECCKHTVDYFDLSLDNFMNSLSFLPDAFEELLKVFEPLFNPDEEVSISKNEFLSIFFDPSNTFAAERYKSLGKIFWHISEEYPEYVTESTLILVGNTGGTQ